MKPEPESFDRRTFLKSGVQTAAAVAALSGAGAVAAVPKNKSIRTAGALPTRPFGKTGHTLPIFGHGGSAMVEQWKDLTGCELPSEADRIAMVRHGYDRGMRYFDTARVYGESERLIGEALKDIRDEVYIASKVAVYSPDKVRESVETTLRELQTDYVDCMQIHSPAIERIGPEKSMEIHAELLKLKDEGMLRFIGLTTHVAFESVYTMLKTGGFDQVLLAKGYFRKGMDTLLSDRNLEWRELCFSEAHEQGIAIVNMKVFGNWIYGHNSRNVVPEYAEDKETLSKLPGAALRWALQDPRISMFNIGITIPSDIDETAALFESDWTFSDEDRRVLAEFTGKLHETEYVKGLRIV